MRTMTMILVALVLAACSGCEDSASKEPKPPRAAVTWPGNTYHLVLRFDGGGMDGVVDEKTIIMPTHKVTRTLVEYFGIEAAGNKWCIDNIRPTASMVPGIIYEGKVYPARVTGVDVDENTFGVLPQNMDGSVVTSPDIALYFNADFFASHAITGEIVQTGPAIHYRTECRADGLLVTWDGEDHFFPRS